VTVEVVDEVLPLAPVDQVAPAPALYSWAISSSLLCEPVKATVDGGTGDVTITQEAGDTITFAPNGSGGYNAPGWADATLVEASGPIWTFTRLGTQTFSFNSSGQLTSETDLDGYVTTLSYASGKLATVTDPPGAACSSPTTGPGWSLW